jgi:hypothetical protein
MTILARIKRAVLAGRFELSEKARIEMFADGLFEQDLVEAVASARRINKTLTSTSPRRRGRERLYVIISENLQGVRLYTKGKFANADGIEIYYFFVSAKCDQ